MTTPLKRFIEHACDAGITIGINPTGKRPGQAAWQPDPPNRMPMAAKKKRKPKSLRATDRPISVLSTAVGNLKYGRDRGHIRVGAVVLVRR